MSVQSFHQLHLTCDNPHCQTKSTVPIDVILAPNEEQCVQHAKGKGWIFGMGVCSAAYCPFCVGIGAAHYEKEKS